MTPPFVFLHFSPCARAQSRPGRFCRTRCLGKKRSDFGQPTTDQLRWAPRLEASQLLDACSPQQGQNKLLLASFAKVYLDRLARMNRPHLAHRPPCPHPASTQRRSCWPPRAPHSPTRKVLWQVMIVELTSMASFDHSTSSPPLLAKGPVGHFHACLSVLLILCGWLLTWLRRSCQMATQLPLVALSPWRQEGGRARMCLRRLGMGLVEGAESWSHCARRQPKRRF